MVRLPEFHHSLYIQRPADAPGEPSVRMLMSEVLEKMGYASL